MLALVRVAGSCQRMIDCHEDEFRQYILSASCSMGPPGAPQPVLESQKYRA